MWILIFMLCTPNGSSLTYHEFSKKYDCETVGKATQSMKGSFSSSNWKCIKMSMQE